MGHLTGAPRWAPVRCERRESVVEVRLIVLKAYVRAIDWLTDSLGAVSRTLVLVLIPIGFLNVLLRYIGQFTHSQLVNNTWIEAQWYMYGIIFLLMFPYLLRHDLNVRVDFWYAERSDRAKAWIDLIGHLVGLIPFTLLSIWISWQPVTASWSIWEGSPDPNGLPRAPIKALILVAFVLLLLQAIATLIRIWALFWGHTDEFGEVFERHEAPLRIE